MAAQKGSLQKKVTSKKSRSTKHPGTGEPDAKSPSRKLPSIANDKPGGQDQTTARVATGTKKPKPVSSGANRTKMTKPPTARTVTAEVVNEPLQAEDVVDTVLPSDVLLPNAPAPAEIESWLEKDEDPSEVIEVSRAHKDLAKPRLPSSTGKELVSADPVSIYLSEVRKYPVLSREAEAELAKKYFETKDPTAAQALVTANLRFVVKVAGEYSRFGARMIDLIQEGNVGLMHAVREFNPYKGVRLITYAVWWIRGYIQEYLMKQYSMVKIGTTQNQKRLFYQLQKEKAALDALGSNPSVQLIAEKLGIPADEVQDMSRRLSGRDVSLDAPLDDDTGPRLKDLQKSSADDPESSLEQMELLRMLEEKIEEIRPRLNAKETLLLEERILADDPLTLQEIGEKWGTTREAVRQMEVRLMGKLKTAFLNPTEEKSANPKKK